MGSASPAASAGQVGDHEHAPQVPAVDPGAGERREQQHRRQHDVGEQGEQQRGAGFRELSGVLGEQADQREVGQALAQDRDELAPPQRGEVALRAAAERTVASSRSGGGVDGAASAQDLAVDRFDPIGDARPRELERALAAARRRADARRSGSCDQSRQRPRERRRRRRAGTATPLSSGDHHRAIAGDVRRDHRRVRPPWPRAARCRSSRCPRPARRTCRRSRTSAAGPRSARGRGSERGRAPPTAPRPRSARAGRSRRPPAAARVRWCARPSRASPRSGNEGPCADRVGRRTAGSRDVRIAPLGERRDGRVEALDVHAVRDHVVVAGVVGAPRSRRAVCDTAMRASSRPTTRDRKSWKVSCRTLRLRRWCGTCRPAGTIADWIARIGRVGAIGQCVCTMSNVVAREQALAARA